MAVDWFSLGLISAISQGFLLCIVILSLNTGHKLSNRFLALCVGINTIPMVIYALITYEIPLSPAVYSFFLITVLKGPAIYLYVRALTEPDFKVSSVLSIHGLPIIPAGLVFLFLLSGIGFNQPTSLQLFFGQTQIPLFTSYINLTILAYSTTSLLKLSKHTLRLEGAISNTESINLNWLKGLILFVISTCILHFVLDIATLLAFDINIPKAILVLILNLGFIYFISIGGMRQPVIFTEKLQLTLAQSPSLEEPGSIRKNEEKYQHSGLKNQKIDDIWQKLNHLFSTKQSYLDEELTLPQLAELLEEKTHDLSQTINQKAGINFYELINQHRIEAAKELLSLPENNQRKMLDIATSAGFKSQSTFYNQFKKHTGKTPKQYKEEIQLKEKHTASIT